MPTVEAHQVLTTFESRSREFIPDDDEIAARLAAGDLSILDPDDEQESEPQLRTISARVLDGKINIIADHLECVPGWIAGAKKYLVNGDVTEVPGDVQACWDNDALKASVLAFLASCGLSIDEDMQDTLGDSGMILKSCGFHNDMDGFADRVFCIVWLSDDLHLDLVFPHIDIRVPLSMGTIVLFDSCQPHGVVGRGERGHEDAPYSGLPISACYSVNIPLYLEGLMSFMGIETYAHCTPWDGVKLEFDNGSVIDAATGVWTA